MPNYYTSPRTRTVSDLTSARVPAHKKCLKIIPRAGISALGQANLADFIFGLIISSSYCLFNCTGN